MKIGYVIKRYPRFSETFIVNEIIAREARGTQIVIASLRQPLDPRFHSLLARVQAPVTWIPYSASKREPLVWEALRALRDAGRTPSVPTWEALMSEEPAVASQALLVAKWGLDNEVTHLHAHFATISGRTTRLAAKLLGVPWTITSHAKDIFHEDNDPEVQRWVYNDASRVIGVSDMTSDCIREIAPEANVERVYNGMDLTQFAFSEPAQRPPRVVTVGRLVEKKGIPYLVRAMAKVRERGIDAQLDIVGEGADRALIEGTIAQTGMGAATTMYGPLPQHDVKELVGGAAVFAAPCVVASDGDRDGLPTVLLEAMALGTPVIGTPVTGIPEAVEDEATGLIVPEHAVDELADAIERLLTDADLRVRLARAGRTRIEERFDVRGQAGNLDRISESVAADVAAVA